MTQTKKSKRALDYRARHCGSTQKEGLTMNNLKQNILALLVFTMLCIDPDSIINLVVSLL